MIFVFGLLEWCWDTFCVVWTWPGRTTETKIARKRTTTANSKNIPLYLSCVHFFSRIQSSWLVWFGMSMVVATTRCCCCCYNIIVRVFLFNSNRLLIIYSLTSLICVGLGGKHPLRHTHTHTQSRSHTYRSAYKIVCREYCYCCSAVATIFVVIFFIFLFLLLSFTPRFLLLLSGWKELPSLNPVNRTRVALVRNYWQVVSVILASCKLIHLGLSFSAHPFATGLVRHC